VRPGNGAMDQLQQEKLFDRPSVQSLEAVLEYGISLQSGRVFADLWDLEQFSGCDLCLASRTERLNSMNLNQTVPSPVSCSCTP